MTPRPPNTNRTLIIWSWVTLSLNLLLSLSSASPRPALGLLLILPVAIPSVLHLGGRLWPLCDFALSRITFATQATISLFIASLLLFRDGDWIAYPLIVIVGMLLIMTSIIAIGIPHELIHGRGVQSSEAEAHTPCDGDPIRKATEFQVEATSKDAEITSPDGPRSPTSERESVALSEAQAQLEETIRLLDQAKQELAELRAAASLTREQAMGVLLITRRSKIREFAIGFIFALASTAIVEIAFNLPD